MECILISTHTTRCCSIEIVISYQSWFAPSQYSSPISTSCLSMCKSTGQHAGDDESYNSQSVNFLSFSWASWRTYHHPSAIIGVGIGISIILLLFCFYGNQAYNCLIPKYFRKRNTVNQLHHRRGVSRRSECHRMSQQGDLPHQELTLMTPHLDHCHVPVSPSPTTIPRMAAYNTEEIAELKSRLSMAWMLVCSSSLPSYICSS